MDPTKNDNHVKWYLATQVILSAAHMNISNKYIYSQIYLKNKSHSETLTFPLKCDGILENTSMIIILGK